MVDGLLYIFDDSTNHSTTQCKRESGFFQYFGPQSLQTLVCFLLVIVTEDGKFRHMKNITGISLRQLIIIISSIIG